MDDLQHSELPTLTAEEIQAEVVQRLKRYEKLNFLEQFAMFMGISQIVESNLRQLLNRKFGVEFEDMERLSLGQVAYSLKQHALRKDFTTLLDSVVKYRNHIAHSLLANQITLHSLGAGNAGFEVKTLQKGIYELEQLWFLYEWTEEHNAWG